MIVCFLLKLRLITTSFTLPVKYSAESSELTPLPEKKKYIRAAYFRICYDLAVKICICICIFLIFSIFNS